MVGGGGVSDVAVRIRAAYALLNGSPALGRARQSGVEASEVLARTVDGTTNATAKAASALLASVPDLLDEVAAAIGQGNQAAREYLSAIGASGGTAVVGNAVVAPDERAGAKTLAPDESDTSDTSEPDDRRRRRRSRAERMNAIIDKIAEKGDDVADAVKEGVEGVQRGLTRPSGQTVSSGVQATPPPAEHVGTPDLLQSTVIVGAVAIEGVRLALSRMRDSQHRRKEDHE